MLAEEADQCTTVVNDSVVEGELDATESASWHSDYSDDDVSETYVEVAARLARESA
jgi:hypothetical protein